MISDEYGVPVLVTAHSPANSYINLLKRRGFTWIVLQRKLFLGLTTPADYATMDVSVNALSTEQTHPPRTLPPGATGTLPELWALLRIRLFDCIEVLNGG